LTRPYAKSMLVSIVLLNHLSFTSVKDIAGAVTLQRDRSTLRAEPRFLIAGLSCRGGPREPVR